MKYNQGGVFMKDNKKEQKDKLAYVQLEPCLEKYEGLLDSPEAIALARELEAEDISIDFNELMSSITAKINEANLSTL